MPTLQTPPGRMGRLWLTDRLELAERGVSILEQKLRLLAERRDVLRARVEQSRRDWHAACRRADRWGLRAVLLGGDRAIDLAAPLQRATVTVEWTTTTGVRYPDQARCAFPPDDDTTIVDTGSATRPAARAHRAALAAAAEHAVALAALATVEREYRTTQLRVRALSKHWLPRLRDELRRVTLELEEQDRAESSRLRLAGMGYGTSADAARAPGDAPESR